MNTTLESATRSLIATAQDSTATEEDVNADAQKLFDALGKASRDDANEVIRQLSEQFGMEDPSRAAFLALVCGALVERGCDPMIMCEPLTKRLASLFDLAAAFSQACIEHMPEKDDQNGEQDPNEAFEQVRMGLAAAMPQESGAWEALNQFWRPAIAMFSISPATRESAIEWMIRCISPRQNLGTSEIPNPKSPKVYKERVKSSSINSSSASSLENSSSTRCA